jgi:ABC-type phosphonate transport system ATPase subunit
VLLKIMAFAGNIGQRFEAVGQAHLGDLAQRGVRLFRRRGIDAGADGALLRAVLQGRNLVALRLGAARLANKLIDCRNSYSSWSSVRPHS